MPLPPIIAENTATAAEWSDDSFVGILHETYRWDHNKFVDFEQAVLQIAGNEHDDATVAALFRIFDYLMVLFTSHFDPSDYFTFKSLTIEEIFECRDRVQTMFSAYFIRDSSTTNLHDQTA